MSDRGLAVEARIAEMRLRHAIEPLLVESGYSFRLETDDFGFDYRAGRPASGGHARHSIGIIAKISQTPITGAPIQRLLQHRIESVDRAMLVSDAGFSSSARKISAEAPVKLELLTTSDLAAWAESFQEKKKPVEALIQQAVSDLSRKFVGWIADQPDRALAALKWYQMEETVAEIFSGLGFKATLTPPAKDGGKDVVLACEIGGQGVEYYIEIKHWRSGKKVGSRAVNEFVELIARDKKNGGLFLSTHGYTRNAFSHLSEIARETINFAGRQKLVTLCRTYQKATSGIWSPPSSLAEVLSEDYL